MVVRIHHPDTITTRLITVTTYTSPRFTTVPVWAATFTMTIAITSTAIAATAAATAININVYLQPFKSYTKVSSSIFPRPQPDTLVLASRISVPNEEFMFSVLL